MSKKSIKGTVGEHKVIVQLLEEGYHVAKAVDQQCPFDLVAVSEEGDVKLLDVKTISYRKKTKPNWEDIGFNFHLVLPLMNREDVISIFGYP